MPKDILHNSLKTLYQLQNKLPKLVEDASIPEQEMDHYYVELQIVLDDKKAGIEKPPIEIGKIFDPAGDQGEVGKVIITGVAGVGKTTLLNHITYEWSKNKIFDEKFDYIFKIRLKNLLNKHMVNELSRYDREDILPALIQRSFEQQLIEQVDQNRANNAEGIQDSIFRDMLISLDEIKVIDRSRTVLLLDGYDEIEHLNRGGHIVRELMSLILEYPNVVVTSRPNALSSVLDNRFERKIENVGIGYDGAQGYIEKYFKAQSTNIIKEIENIERTSLIIRSVDDLLSQLRDKNQDLYSYLELIHPEAYGETIAQFKHSIEQYHDGIESKLLELYRQNPSLKEVLAIPINVAMICMISIDPGISGRAEILDTFKSDFNIGQLYQSTVDWLSIRYLMKFEGRARGDIAYSGISNLDHSKVLKYVAYEKFQINEAFILGEYIDVIAQDIDHKLGITNPDLGIRQINKIGLLKAASHALHFELILHRGAVEDSQFTSNKIFLFLDNEGLYYALKGRNGIERFVINELDGLSNSFQNIKNALLDTRERRLPADDLKALAEHIESNSGYITYQQENRGIISRLGRSELDESDLIHRKHAFIHSSFQEYLTAYKLRELLISDDKDTHTQAAQFIGKHRNEPRYLLTLKFLAGIVTNDQSPNSNILVQRFWETVTCNVDGVIELGLEAKVTLLMHLLAQTKIDGELDDRIPSLNKIKELIDTVVILGITRFHEQLIASGYNSPKIQEAALAILDLNYKWKIEDTGRIIQEKSEFAELAKVNLKKIANSPEYAKAQRELAKTILLDNNLEFIFQEGIETKQEKIITLRKSELQSAMKMALKLVANADIPSKVLVDKLLIILYMPDWQIKLIAINALEQLIKKSFLGLTIKLSKEIINLLQWHITDNNLKREVLNLVYLIKYNLKTEIEKIEIESFIAKIIIKQIQIYNEAMEIKELENVLLPFFKKELIDEYMIFSLIVQLKNTN